MTLKQRIKLLEELLKHATDVIDELTYENRGEYFTGNHGDVDVTDKVKYIIDKTDKYFTNED